MTFLLYKIKVLSRNSFRKKQQQKRGSQHLSLRNNGQKSCGAIFKIIYISFMLRHNWFRWTNNTMNISWTVLNKKKNYWYRTLKWNGKSITVPFSTILNNMFHDYFSLAHAIAVNAAPSNKTKLNNLFWWQNKWHVLCVCVLEKRSSQHY